MCDGEEDQVTDESTDHSHFEASFTMRLEDDDLLHEMGAVLLTTHQYCHQIEYDFNECQANRSSERKARLYSDCVEMLHRG